jgi:dTDP-4-dehydrorhamnose 3,5-epimerase
LLFVETPLQGAFVIDLQPVSDERGFFARAWCQHEFEEHGLESRLAQCSVSFNYSAGTLRGLHYQAPPHEEVKIVRCTSGAVFDVIVDLRPNSSTYAAHHSVILSAANRRMLYIPEGFAHGFQTLEDNTEVYYQMSEFYAPDAARGVRWNDPAFGIVWPHAERLIIAERDRTYPDFHATHIPESRSR